MMTATTPASARPRRIRRIVLIVIGVLILIAIVLPSISLGRYHHTIAASLARSIGHPVYLDSVNLTAFPLPGFEIHNLTIEEDPAFGAEPLLRAPEVTVFPRLSSLWTGRLEISRIDVDDASVNLVRDPGGNWNLSSLLLKAARTRLAPTAQRHRGSAPRFPYISFHNARINFKQGAEKKPLSFLNTDAAVWLSGPNRWRIRLKAQPARTDLDIDVEDIGTVRLSGSLTRAASLDQIPLSLHAQWTGAQLGQAGLMLLGHESLWLGTLDANANIIGTMDNLALSARFHVSNLHRIEFTPAHQVSLDTRCRAVYHHGPRSLDNLVCLLPTGAGHLLLTGSIPQIGRTAPQLNLEINHTPVAFAMRYFGLLRSNLAGVLTASGDINGDFAWAQPGAANAASVPASAKQAASQPSAGRAKLPSSPASSQQPAEPNVLTGQAAVTNLALQLANAGQPFIFPILRFNTPAPQPRRRRHKKRGAQPEKPVILLQPAVFSAGAAAPMQVAGQFTRSGFHLAFAGEAAIARLLPLASDLDQLSALASLEPRGTALADLAFASPWVLPISLAPDITPGLASGLASGGAAQGALTGFARIENARIHPAWLGQPVVISTATVQFNPGGGPTAAMQVNWVNAQASVNGIAFKGSASWPLDCSNPAGCPAQLSLDFPTLSLSALTSTLTGPGRHNEFLEAILSRVESRTPWPDVRADVHAGTLTIGRLRLANARASLAVQDHQLQILSLDAAALGGSIHSTGSVHPTLNGPDYALNLTWTGIKLPQAAAIFHETWPSWGAASVYSGQAVLHLHGYAQLAASATGTFRWLAVNRSRRKAKAPLWSTVASDLPSGSPSRHPRARHKLTPSWAAAGTIANSALTLTQGPLRGAIAFNRGLNLTLAARPEEKITGTLAHPVPSHPSRPLPPRTKRSQAAR